MREISGATFKVFQSQSHDKVSDALQEAANAAADLELLDQGFIRAIHQYDMASGTHDILLIVEGVLT